jgi:hypothetical protein
VTATPTSKAKADKREDEDSETVTTKTKITQTIVQCQTSAIGNCPNSLQVTTQTTETRTLTTVVPSGAEVTWPETLGVSNSVISTKEFGDNALSFTATSGSPTSYTPPPTPTSSAKDDKDDSDDSESKVTEVLNEKTGGVSNKVIIGVSVGAGIAVIIGLVAVLLYVLRSPPYQRWKIPQQSPRRLTNYSYLRRKKAYKAVPAPSFAPETSTAEPYQRVGSRNNSDGFEQYRWENKGKGKPSIDITEIRR